MNKEPRCFIGSCFYKTKYGVRQCVYFICFWDLLSLFIMKTYIAHFHAYPDPALHFNLPLSLEARDELNDLTHIINGWTLQSMEPNAWIFFQVETEYRPRKFYKFLFRNITDPSYITKIGKSKCIMRHKVFAWLMLMDKVNQRDMLLRRHFNIRENHSCWMCNTSDLETNKHLFMTVNLLRGVGI